MFVTSVSEASYQRNVGNPVLGGAGWMFFNICLLGENIISLAHNFTAIIAYSEVLLKFK